MQFLFSLCSLSFLLEMSRECRMAFNWQLAFPRLSISFSFLQPDIGKCSFFWSKKMVEWSKERGGVSVKERLNWAERKRRRWEGRQGGMREEGEGTGFPFTLVEFGLRTSSFLLGKKFSSGGLVRSHARRTGTQWVFEATKPEIVKELRLDDKEELVRQQADMQGINWGKKLGGEKGSWLYYSDNHGGSDVWLSCLSFSHCLTCTVTQNSLLHK